jgi:tetratricopeptide (TPR) repeat protein
LIALSPDSPDVLGLIAYVKLIADDPRAASEFAERALARDPDEGTALITRAVARVRLGRLDGALEDARRHYRAHPDAVLGLAVQADIEMRREAPGRACRELIVSPLPVLDAYAGWVKGRALVALGERARGLAQLEAARQLSLPYRSFAEELEATIAELETD